MKPKDIGIIAGVAVVSAIFSYIIAGYIFNGDKSYSLKAPSVEPISAEFKLPSDKYFNKDSLNPTKDITIGDSSNQKPF